jgi:RNA polymerase II subunit A-like phosphatase
MARKRGGIKIVWLAWFTDSIALWSRQDEKPYFLDDPPLATSSNPPMDNQHSGYIESEEDQGPPLETKETGRLELAAINWDDINDEVEAAMLESDDEDDMKSERSGMRSENVSEDEMGSEIG